MSNEKPELLPCPFCGQAPKLDEQGVKDFDDSAWTFIGCNSCCVRSMASASVPWRWTMHDDGRMFVGRTKEEAKVKATMAAIEKWNRRRDAARS